MGKQNTEGEGGRGVLRPGLCCRTWAVIIYTPCLMHSTCLGYKRHWVDWRCLPRSGPAVSVSATLLTMTKQFINNFFPNTLIQEPNNKIKSISHQAHPSALSYIPNPQQTSRGSRQRDHKLRTGLLVLAGTLTAAFRQRAPNSDFPFAELFIHRIDAKVGYRGSYGYYAPEREALLLFTVILVRPLDFRSLLFIFLPVSGTPTSTAELGSRGCLGSRESSQPCSFKKFKYTFSYICLMFNRE